MSIQSKAFSGPVKSIPKVFSDADPVEDIPRPCLVQLNRFLKIFLKQSLSMETKSGPSLIPVTSQENYLWTTDCRLIPVTSQENYLREKIED